MTCRFTISAFALAAAFSASTSAVAGPLNPAKAPPRRAPPITERDAIKPQGLGATLTGCTNAAKDMTPSGRAANASCLIDDKWTAVRDRLGAFQASGDAALHQLRRDGAAHYAQYERGRIYVADSTLATVAVFGPVAEAYVNSGGAAGPMGLPLRDSARFNEDPAHEAGEFGNGRILWWGDLGALLVPGKHNVYGAIARRYAQLGGATGKLGAPISSEEDYGDGEGRVTRFERGTLYWWPDTGAFEGRPISIIFKGFHCYAESDNDQSSAADEPYFIFASYGPNGQNGGATRSKIFENVDAGEEHAASVIAYSGGVDRVVLGASVWEYDFGDPEKYKKEISAAAKAAGQAAGSYFGPAGSAVAGEIASAIGGAFSDFLDTGDELVDHKEFIYSARDLLRLSQLPKQVSGGGITYSFQSELLESPGEGSFVLFFEVRQD